MQAAAGGRKWRLGSKKCEGAGRWAGKRKWVSKKKKERETERKE